MGHHSQPSTSYMRIMMAVWLSLDSEATVRKGGDGIVGGKGGTNTDVGFVANQSSRGCSAAGCTHVAVTKTDPDPTHKHTITGLGSCRPGLGPWPCWPRAVADLRKAEYIFTPHIMMTVLLVFHAVGSNSNFAVSALISRMPQISGIGPEHAAGSIFTKLMSR